MDTGRRSFLFGLGASIIAAPAIVRVASLMPVRALTIDEITAVAVADGCYMYRDHYVCVVHPAIYREIVRLNLENDFESYNGSILRIQQPIPA